MAPVQNPTFRLLNSCDAPQVPLPALLGPAKQSACFSICNERLEVDSTAALRYFRHPSVDADLRDGLQDFMNLPWEDRVHQYARRLDDAFTICLESENSEELLKAEVVAGRGTMKRIIFGDPLDLNISCYNGVLYLEEETRNNYRAKFDFVDSSLNCERTFVGHKFETICSTDSPEGEPSSAREVDLHTLWNTAITRTLGSLKILLVGEVDCVKPGYSENPGPEHYVELKTKKLEKSCNITWRRWDMQSYLVGTPEIFLGFLDAKDIVRGFDTIPVQHMESQQWRIDWAARVLHSLRDYCARSPAITGGVLKVWRVSARKRYVNIRELTTHEVNTLNKGGVPRNGIVPVSFIRGLESRMSAA
ncbi:hypothetical protein DFH09DRAFT_1151755 [Mycena vulgaris]|nr:hypothetical protein DFH09DRAFT_1151755 [Mycena vulgaris]